MPLRLIGHGHPQIRATHSKTLEFSAANSITARATCVVAVGTVVDPAESMRPAGPVDITITAGSETVSFSAVAHSGWAPGLGAVIRRGQQRLPGTLATESEIAASDLPSSLVEALRSSRTRVEALIQPSARRDRRAELVLFSADPRQYPGAQLIAEIAAADLVIPEDKQALHLVDLAGGCAGTASEVPEIVQNRGRVLVIATSDLPGATVSEWLGNTSSTAVDVFGLPPPLAAAAASSNRDPLVVSDAHDVRQLLRQTPVSHRIAITLDSRRLKSALALAEEYRGSCAAVITQPYSVPQRISDRESPLLLTSGTVSCCFDAVGTVADSELAPDVRSAVETLISSGTSTKAIADALTKMTGRSPGGAYNDVITVKRAMHD